MSKLRAATLGAALFLGVSGIAAAQGKAEGQRHGGMGPRSGMRHGGQFPGRMAKELNLTDAQKTQIKAVHEKYRPQFESIRAQEQAEIRNVLTADQRAKFDAAQTKRKQQMENRRQRSSGERAKRG